MKHIIMISNSSSNGSARMNFLEQMELAVGDDKSVDNNNDLGNKDMNSAVSKPLHAGTNGFKFYTTPLDGDKATNNTVIDTSAILTKSNCNLEHRNNNSSENNTKDNNSTVNTSKLEHNSMQTKVNYVTNGGYQPLEYLSSKKELEMTGRILNNLKQTKSAFVNNLTSDSKQVNSLKTSGQYASESERNSSVLCRNADQENAFRHIENVHNYAKISRYNYSNSTNVSSSNSSNIEDEDEEEDEDDEEEDGGDLVINEPVQVNRRLFVSDDNKTDAPKSQEASPGKDDTKNAPDHHARRPMNAFLIFCKRHRGIVRDKYKHLENRSITKILGEWWAALDPSEKTCYNTLAKQYKDAFFSANPNFKWYKLPAPPLRTLNTRPNNVDRPIGDESAQQLALGGDSLTFISEKSPNAERLELNTGRPHSKARNTGSNGGNVGVFKFADETQLGGLSSLLLNEDNKTSPQNRSDQQALQTALGETTDYFKMTFASDRNEPFENMRDHAKKMQANEDQLSLKRKYPQSTSSEDDLSAASAVKKTARSCKGKKYQEFMSSGQLTTAAKKGFKSLKTSNNVLGKSFDSSSDNSICSDHMETNRPQELVTTVAKEKKTSASITSPESPYKFDTISFDLEDKIQALPALDLDEYLERKRNSKKKKKIGSKKRVATSTAKSSAKKTSPVEAALISAQAAKESMQRQMVGSQKRKARKESITRRDISAIQNEAMEHLVHDMASGTAKTVQQVVEPPVNSFESTDSNANNSSTSDLLILAEVATNHI